MRLTRFTVLGALALTFAVPHGQRGEYAVKESHVVPSRWKQLHRAPSSHTITLQIGLKQASFDDLERQLYEISDPGHERYGQHLKHAEVHKLVAPEEGALDAVHGWLAENNVESERLHYSPAKDWILVSLPVSDVESLLDTEYHVYENDKGTTIVRTPQYSLPAALHRHIDVIQPTNYFGDPKAMRRPFRLSGEQPVGHVPPVPAAHRLNLHANYNASNASAVCNASAVTNLCLRTLYNTVDYVPQVPNENEVAMTAYLNETANVTDFHVFLSEQRKDANKSYTYNYTTISGGPNDQSPVSKAQFGSLDVEANLDSQTIGGIVWPTEFTVYSTGSKPPFTPDANTPTDTNEPYLAWVSYVQNLEKIPATISTSYGDDEQTVPYSYAKRVCEEFAQLGAKGVTLIFSSGDDGVGPNGTCFSNDGNKKPMLLPEFPTSCPYVTSVGATRNIDPEIVAYNPENGYVSRSGMSNYFSRPAYQSEVVEQYLSKIGNLHSGLYNTTGRAYPDIAAQGYHYSVVYAGQTISVDGTSCAAPCATSILTLVNDALIAAGQSPLGFLNPALYKYLHTGFNDITSGSTWGCNSSGFPAQTGWDLASGWGTPDFRKLRVLALSASNSSNVLV